jgi:hypothetical protein
MTAGGTPTVSGNYFSGTIVAGTGTVTGCSLAWPVPWSATPVCQGSVLGTTPGYASVTFRNTFSVTFATSVSLAGTGMTYQCSLPGN